MYLSIRKVTGIKHIFSFTNKYTHVTIDTVDDSVKHFQANTVCELALSGSQKEENQSNICVINFGK
jgi:uncharacterized protein YggL (DUF469 family)